MGQIALIIKHRIKSITRLLMGGKPRITPMYQLKRKSTKIFMLALKAIGNMEEGCVEYPMQN